MLPSPLHTLPVPQPPGDLSYSSASPLVMPPAQVAPQAPPPAPGPSGGFWFTSYGRLVASTDGHGQPGRDADLVVHGSRLDEPNYTTLELRRNDAWSKTRSSTQLVAMLAIVNPFLNYTGIFDSRLAVRNFYLEERDLGLRGLSIWGGSRMYRGDDIYVLDWWPLDSVNTVGGGARYESEHRMSIALHGGLSKPEGGFFGQVVERPLPFSQPGVASVELLKRQKFIGSLKLSHQVPIGKKAGIKGAVYAEAHELPGGRRETGPGAMEPLPADRGQVVGLQLGGTGGERSTHVNVFLRHARGLAAYGEFATPTGLAPDGTTAGAHEFVAALGSNWEHGPLGVMLAGYFRSFRNASPGLDFNDTDEGLVLARPHLFFGELGGIAVEGSYQALRRRVPPAEGGREPPSTRAHDGCLVRFGLVPFLSPAGRGGLSRPHLRLIWLVTRRDTGARRLYPQDDEYSSREIDHFLGFGAEWWFNLSTYGN